MIVAAIAVSISVRRSHERRAELADWFGPEYERTVGAADGARDRRRAEHELAERADRRDDLDLHPLPVEARERYSEQWRRAQARFVDEPQAAIGEAEQLLDAVMRERGYPSTGSTSRPRSSRSTTPTWWRTTGPRTGSATGRTTAR